MKNLFFTLLVFITSAAFAQDPDKTVNLKASGSGTTQEQAKNNALRSAVEQAYGAFISSKTEILNDQVLADEIVSVASGNIQAFKILEEQHTDSLDFCLLEAVVSISKLTSFAQSKGYAVEVQGGMFAINIKQKQLNESAEVVAIRNGLTTALDILDNGFDFKIKTSEPVVNDAIKGDWKMLVDVETYTNENYVSAHKIVHSLLNSISMNEQEVAEYKTLGKTVYQLNYHYPDQTAKTYHLRTSDGLWAFIRFTYKIPNLTQRFKISDGIKDYKNGVQLDYENISNITFQESLASMVQQYNNLANDGLNRDWKHPNLLQKHYDLQKKINPLKSEDDKYGYYKKRNLLYSNDSYYEFFPIVCVEKLDYFELSITKAANCNLTFIYSLQEIEKINEIKSTPLEENVNPLSKGLFQMIDITGMVTLNSAVQTPAKDSRPFIFREPIDRVDYSKYSAAGAGYNDLKGIQLFKGSVIGESYVKNLLDYKRLQDSYGDPRINNQYLTAILEKEFESMPTTNLRKGLYQLTIDYIVETDGTVTLFNVPNVEFYEKSEPTKFLLCFGHYNEAQALFKLNWNDPNPLITPINESEGEIIANWLLPKIKEIKNHPAGLPYQNTCSKPVKCRALTSSVFTFYVN